MRAACWWVGLVSVGAAWVAAATPPVVVRAFPDNGDIGVDPATDRITVTFDQAMDPRGFSVVGGGENFPEITEKIQWESAETVVIPVRLRADHEYRLWINNARFQNFRNVAGEPAESYPIRFTTGPGRDGKPADARDRERNGAALDRAVELLGTVYSHRDRLGIDWAAKIGAQREVLATAASPFAFAQGLGTVLAQGRDKHMLLRVGEQDLPTFVNPIVPNVNPERVAELVPGYTRVNGIIERGRFDDGTEYLAIDSWNGSQKEQVEAACEAIWAMSDAPGLIIDVRLNGGGSESLAAMVAGCFVEKSVPYARHESVTPGSPGGFGPVRTRTLSPNRGGPRFRGKVVVLTGPVVMSSNEAFVLMMRAAGATLVGARTQGSSGNPRPYDLGNGVTLLLPSWRAMTLDGKPFEGVGIEPDVLVSAEPRAFDAGDPVLAKAREVLAGDR